MEDVDFKLKVTRDQLETMCADIFEKIAHPVQEALKSADITIVSLIQLSQVWHLTIAWACSRTTTP